MKAPCRDRTRRSRRLTRPLRPCLRCAACRSTDGAPPAALANACDGGLEDAKSLVERAAGEKLDGEWLWKKILAKEMLAVRAAGPGAAGRRARATALHVIRLAARLQIKVFTPAMARQFRRASRAMARHASCRVWPWDLLVARWMP